MGLGLTEIASSDRALALLIALAAEAALPLSPLWDRVSHPVALFGALVDTFDRRLNREGRSDRARFIRGAVVALLLASFAAAIGYGLDRAFHAVPYGWVGEVVVLAVMLAQRSLFEHVRHVARALGKGGLEAGRAAVARIVGRNVTTLDDHGVARAAIESTFENFSDAVVAPAFWYLILGLPGLLAYKAVNTMDSMIGHRTPRHRAFGCVAARLDDIANFIPARVSAFLIALAAVAVPSGRPVAALTIAFRDGAKHRSVNAGYPEAAAAGALGLALGGPRRYGAETVRDPWLGAGRAMATVADIVRALYLYVASCLVNGLLVAGVLYARGVF